MWFDWLRDQDHVTVILLIYSFIQSHDLFIHIVDSFLITILVYRYLKI